MAKEAEASRSTITNGIMDPDYKYPVNDDGKTYGPDWEGDNYDDHAPDLIEAVGKNGNKGYVKKVDLQTEGDRVKSLEEAEEYQKVKDERVGRSYYQVIPVFKEDGKTEIDQFWIYNGSTKDDTKVEN